MGASLITVHSTLGEVAAILAAAGARVESLTSNGGCYSVRLALDEAHATPQVSGGAGRGASIAEAIEDARVGLASWHRRACVARSREALQAAVARHLATPGRETEASVADAAADYRDAAAAGE